jgi:hypothetical protein
VRLPRDVELNGIHSTIIGYNDMTRSGKIQGEGLVVGARIATRDRMTKPKDGRGNGLEDEVNDKSRD